MSTETQSTGNKPVAVAEGDSSGAEDSVSRTTELEKDIEGTTDLKSRSNGESSQLANGPEALDETKEIATSAAQGGDDEERRIPLDEQPKRKIALVMGSICMAVFLAALDMSIVSTALPSIAGDFHISQDDYNWIGSAYMLGCAAATPPWGKISDIFGRKPVLLAANVVFLVGSLVCGLAVDAKMLIAGRAVQGIGSGGLLALANICVADLFSQRSRGLYYGFIGGVWAVAGAVGPILGGAFAQYSTWRWCFYINLPCDAIALVVLFFFLDVHTPPTPIVAGLIAIDWLGLVTAAGGVVTLLMGLEYGGVSYPWSSAIVLCLIIFGLLLIMVFFLIEWKVAKYPLMPLRLFTERSNMFAFASTFCHAFAFISASYFLPLYFQTVLDSSPFVAGLQQLGFISAISLTGIFVGYLVRKTGDFKTLIVVGMSFMALGFGLFIYLPDHPDYGRIVPAQLIAGLGTGTNFQAPLIALQAHSEPADIATVSATFAFIRQAGTAISLIVGAAIFQNRLRAYAGTLSTVVNQTIVTELAGGDAASSVHTIQTLPEPARSVVHTVFTDSFQAMWIFYTVVAVCGFGFSLFIRKKTLSTKHEVRKQGLETEERERKERLAKKAAQSETGRTSAVEKQV